jgi:hypothetical protein
LEPGRLGFLWRLELGIWSLTSTEFGTPGARVSGKQIAPRRKSEKICLYGIDAAASWANLLVPLDAGPDVIGVVLVHFGTANWLNFVPTTINGNPPRRASCDSKVGGEVEFFLPKKCARLLVL